MQQMPMIPSKAFQTSFGGSLLKNSHAKVARPFSPRAAIHVVLKSSKANKENSFYKHKKFLQRLLEKQSRKHFVKIYQWQSMGNHLHLLVKCKDKSHFNFNKDH